MGNVWIRALNKDPFIVAEDDSFLSSMLTTSSARFSFRECNGMDAPTRTGISVPKWRC
jgi:hypothetical protein